MADQSLIPVSGQANALSPFRLAAFTRFAANPAVRQALPAIGLAGGIGVAALAWWAFQSPAQAPVFAGLGDADKAAVADALGTAGMAYTLDTATGAVLVSEDEIHKARILLASQGLPKAAPAGDSVIASLPMGSSRAIEGETLKAARQADLARTIEAIDPVKAARVHLAVPEASAFVRDAAAPAASVMVTLEQGRTLATAQVRAIRHLVASSVPGMTPERVSIVDQAGGLLSRDANGGDDRNLQLQAQIEERYRAALTGLLAPMVGAGNYTAEIHADVDFSESQATRESYPKDDRALRREEGNRASSSPELTAVGIPGALSNTPPPASQISDRPGPVAPAPAAQAAAPVSENYARSFDNGREISVTHRPQGRVSRLTVAVALRAEKGKPRGKAELDAIEALVKGAVGFDAARGDVVALSSRPFVSEVTEETAFWDAPWFMTALRQGGALIAALLAFFFIGRPLIAAFRRRREAADARASDLERHLLSATGEARPTREITLEMIEAAPSYEARAALVRHFVAQDSARAALVVRQLLQEQKP